MNISCETTCYHWLNLMVFNYIIIFYNYSATGATTLPWGLINLYIATSVQSDQSVGKRLCMLSMACLRASGTIRAYSEIRNRDTKSKDLYTALGFSMVTPLISGNFLINT